MGFRGGGQIDPPPSVSWFSSTPAGIGLRDCTDIWIKWEETFMDENIYVYLRLHR